MKLKIYFLIIAITLLISGYTLQRIANKSNAFKGAWQINQFVNVEGDRVYHPARFIKIYHDSTFHSYMLTNKGAIIFVEGTYKIINDSLFNETVSSALNQAMNGKTNHFKYEIDGNILRMSGVVNAQFGGGKAELLESWVKVDFPK